MAGPFGNAWLACAALNRSGGTLVGRYVDSAVLSWGGTRRPGRRHGNGASDRCAAWKWPLPARSGCDGPAGGGRAGGPPPVLCQLRPKVPRRLLGSGRGLPRRAAPVVRRCAKCVRTGPSRPSARSRKMPRPRRRLTAGAPTPPPAPRLAAPTGWGLQDVKAAAARRWSSSLGEGVLQPAAHSLAQAGVHRHSRGYRAQVIQCFVNALASGRTA